MKFFLVLLTLISFNSNAYVPTVESLLRHGSNPDVTANGVALTLEIKKIGASQGDSKDSGLFVDQKNEDFFKLYFTKVSSDLMKVAQARFANNSFGDSALIDRQFYSNFSAHALKAGGEEAEKGLFFGMLRSMIFNDGVFLINYLKTLNVPVKLNNEIINRQKVEYLASYKQYLIAINKDRTNKRSMPNPLKPADAALREKIEAVMNEPMYVDQKMVSLISEEGQMGWLISASGFEAIVSQKERDITRIKFKSTLGEFEIHCKEYWLANGTHRMPRSLIVKDFKGETYQVEIMNMKHYLEKEADLIGRLKKWDSILKGKNALEPRPPFLL